MKKWTFLISAVVCIIGLCACEPTEQEKMLEGRWLGRQTETDDDGNRIVYKISFEFNRDRDYMGYQMIIELAGCGELAVMSCSGDWLADEEEILMFPDEDSLTIEYADVVEYSSRAMGLPWSDLKYIIETAISKDLDNIMSIPIKSLNRNELRVEFDDEILRMYKQM